MKKRKFHVSPHSSSDTGQNVNFSIDSEGHALPLHHRVNVLSRFGEWGALKLFKWTQV